MTYESLKEHYIMLCLFFFSWLFSSYSAFFFYFNNSDVLWRLTQIRIKVHDFSHTDDVALLICLQDIDAGVPAVYQHIHFVLYKPPPAGHSWEFHQSRQRPNHKTTEELYGVKSFYFCVSVRQSNFIYVCKNLLCYCMFRRAIGPIKITCA